MSKYAIPGSEEHRRLLLRYHELTHKKAYQGLTEDELLEWTELYKKVVLGLEEY